MIEWNPIADLDLPLRLTEPTEIQIDLFGDCVAFEFIAAVFAIMAGSPQHRYTVMVRQPTYALEWFAWVCGQASEFPQWQVLWHSMASRFLDNATMGVLDEAGLSTTHGSTWPVGNVAIGVTISDQQSADELLPILAQIPAGRRIVRATLRGPVDLSLWIGPAICHEPNSCKWRGRANERIVHDGTIACPECKSWAVGSGGFIDQVIISAEDGPDATPVEIGWLTQLAGQVLDAQAPYASLAHDLLDIPSRTGPSLSIEQWPVCDVCDGAGRVDVVSHSHYHAGEPVGDGYTQNMACPRCPEASGQSRAAMNEIRSEDKTPLICIPGHATKRYSEGVRW